MSKFSGNKRIHIALGVADIEASVAFYSVLLGMEPTKRRPQYAKFESEEPSLNLALNELSVPHPAANPGSHFGIQVQSTADVSGATEWLKAQGLAVEVEDQVTCCYAVQDKVWVSDPDGNAWEFFVVTDADAPEFSKNRQAKIGCCEPGDDKAACCT
jgi:catechol 2,3-dioxygenase-like lactoylglutathione lyase family enzyme